MTKSSARMMGRCLLIPLIAFLGLQCVAPGSGMMIKREIKDPPFDFTLSDSDRCSASPDPHHVSGSEYYLIECQSGVRKVDIVFQTNPNSLTVYDVNMNPLHSLTVYPTSGKMTSYSVMTCEQASSPNDCLTYQLDVSLADGKAPLLAHGGLTFSHFAAAPPKFDPSVLTYDIELHAREPTVIGVRAAPGYLVDFEKGFSERGFLARSAWKTYTPQGEEGDVESFKIYVVNPSRSITTEYTVNVHCVKSTNPRLGSVDVEPGRLDPVFRSHKYAYFLRVPEGSRKVSLSMTAVNSRDTQCSIQPEGLAIEQGVTAQPSPILNAYSQLKSWASQNTTTATTGPQSIREPIPIGSSGSVTLRFPKAHHSGNIVVDCVAADDTYKVRYVFSVVSQIGGSTLLQDLEVVGHPFDRSFVPRMAGPYSTLLTKDDADNEQNKWFNFRVTPTNPRAICKVEGREVDPETNLSHYFRVLPGEKRRFRVSVRTPENAVEEEYFVVIGRPVVWFRDARLATRIAHWVGITSSTVSAMKGVTFLNNAKFLHFISLSNRLNAIPETYDAYSKALNKWNLQWDLPENVYLIDSWNKTFYAPPEDYSEVLGQLGRHSEWNSFNRGEGSGQGFDFRSLSGAIAESNLAEISNAEDWNALLKQVAAKVQMWEAPVQQVGADVAANTDWQAVYPNEGAFEDALSRVLSDVLSERSKAAQPSALPGVQQGVEEVVRGPAPALRRLLSDDATALHSIVVRLDADYKAQQSLLNYCSSIVITSVGLLAIGVAYATIWVLYLRDVREGWTTIRQDFPAILKPSRFWTFCFDYALISYLQSCCGILLRQDNRDTAIRLFGMTVTANQMAWFAATMLCLIPLTFLVCSAVVLFRIRQDLIFSRTFQSYHDSHAAEIKATQRFFQWIPLLSHFFTVEITSVAPVTRFPTTQPNISDGSVLFSEDSRTDAPACVGDPASLNTPRHVDVEQGIQKSGYEALLSDREPHKSRLFQNGEVMKVTLPQDAFEARMDTINPSLYNRFPEALVGFSKYKFKNSYDYVANIRAEIQLRHLTSLMNLQSYAVWVPRENLRQDQLDNWNLLFGKSQKGNLFYWVLDRFITAAIIVFLVSWPDQRGITHALAFAFVCLVLAVVYLPPAYATATSKWFRLMETEAERKKHAQHFKQLEEKRFKIWPFRRVAVRDDFLEIRQRKRDHEMWGLYSFWRSFVADPLRGVWELEFWRTQTYLTIKECLAGPCFSELMKFCTLFTLFLGNHEIGVYGNGAASLLGMAFTILALVCLNTDCLREWIYELKLMCRELWFLTRRSLIRLVDFLSEPQLMGHKIVHFLASCQRVLQGQKGVAFQYPGYSGEKVRDYRVDQVWIINNEVGVHLPGVLEHPPKLRNEMEFSDCLQRGRFGVHKTLHINGSIGVHRCTLDRALPIQLPFKQFFHFGKGLEQSTAIQRLAATIQIVNFNESRAVSGYGHPGDDDSFLSFFTDPKLMPEYGRVRTKHQGHGYVVRWLRSKDMIVIRGPGIVSGGEYTVTSVSETPPVEDEDLVSSPSAASTLESFGTSAGPATTEAVCNSSGRLLVPIREGAVPDTRCPVQCSRVGGESFEIDPEDVKIDYLEYHVGKTVRREMILRSRRFLAGPTAYKVTWTIKTKGKKIDATAKAPANGVLFVPWTYDTAPDLTSPITIRDETEGSPLNGVVIDVDPRDTDAHQFILPSARHNGLSRIVAAGLSKLTEFWRTLVGRDPSEDALDDAIPCTIVQCVNPLERQYRVEPNFAEAARSVSAAIEHLSGMKKDLDSPEQLGHLWGDFMSTSEFLSFWNSLGVNVVVRGAWINPLTNANHLYIRENQQRVRDGQIRFRAEIARRIESRIGILSKVLDRYKKWNRAFNDNDLYSAQLARDAVEWRAGQIERMEAHVSSLQRLKSDYEASLPDFQYPMVVEDRLICRSVKLNAQLQIWREQLTAWLFQCEGVSLLAEQGGKSCAQATVDDAMRALERSIRKTEHSHNGAYRTVLHYVISSVGVRGRDTNWKPDPLAAHYCMVRLFDGDPDDVTKVNWHQERWTPCFLKLMGNKIVMMFPHEIDAKAPTPAFTEADLTTRWPWNQMHAYYIPLQCFERMFLSIDPSIAQDTTVGDDVRRMHAKLVFKKNTEIHVDDHYVQSLYTGEFLDELLYGDGPQVLKIRLGHTVRNKYHTEYKHADRFFHGDRCTVLPLTFRFHYSYFNRWQSAIRLAQMNAPHKELGDFDGHVPGFSSSESGFSTPSEPEPAAPVQLSSTSSEESSSMYGSSSDSSGNQYSKTSESVSIQQSSSAKASSAQPPISARPPEAEPPVAAYKGKFRDGRFSGKNGRLYDNNGRVVYDGDWIEGQRWGKGRCIFRDPYGIEWEFDGEFVADEMRKGKLTMIDDHEMQRLRDSKDSADRFRIVAYEGTFKLPRSLRGPVEAGVGSSGKNRDIRRLRSNCAVRVPPGISPQFMQSLFEGGQPIDPHELDDRELVIDIRRAVSACADEETAQATTSWIQSNFGKMRATNFGRQASRGSEASDITIDAVNAIEEYLPHRSRWTRLLDPNAGYQSVLDRFVDGDVVFADGSRYRGSMRNGMPDGRGVLSCPHCPLVCNGFWRKGKPHGYAALLYGEQGAADRLEYYGNFRDGLRDGRGIQLAQNGKIILKGDFKDDKLHGKNCSVELADDVLKQFASTYKRYIGAVEDGIPEGKGKLEWGDGPTYKGEFKDGKRHGQGTMKDKNNRTIISGAWSKDFPEGRITAMVLPDGRVYTGDIRQGQRQGMGELYRRGDAQYEGLWMNDLPNGRGTLYANDGVYEGEFRSGKRHGKGRFEFKSSPLPNGKPRVYEGDWRNDKPDGSGRYLNELGVENTYKFKDGELVASSVKQYKSGMCGKAPTMGAPFLVESSPVTAHDTEYWGLKRKIDSEKVRQLNSQGVGVWEQHESHEFKFVDPANSPRLVDVTEEVPHAPIKDRSQSMASSSDQSSDSLEIRVIEGRNLPNPEAEHPMDPYCKVRVGRHSKKTKPINRAGSNPKWNSTLIFPKRGAQWVEFEVWDKDPLTRDEFVGGGEYDISNFLRSGDRTSQVEVPIMKGPPGKETSAGSVLVQFTIVGNRFGAGSDSVSQSTLQTKQSVPAGQLSQQFCEIHVHSVADLYNTETFGKMDPYVKFELGSNKIQTEHKKNGGRSCAMDFALTMPYNNEPSLRFEVWDHDSLRRDDLVGYGSVNLSTFTTGAVEIFRDSKEGRLPAGTLNLSVKIVKT